MKTLILITGPSGSGKDHLVKRLEENFNIQQIKSYTTRSKRSINEDTYHFISYKEVNSYINSAFQIFVDVNTQNIYFSTINELENKFRNSDYATLIVTPQSVLHINRILTGFGYDVLYIHLNTPEYIRYNNMKQLRGDKHEDIVQREKMDSFINSEYGKFLVANKGEVRDEVFKSNDEAYEFLSAFMHVQPSLF